MRRRVVLGLTLAVVSAGVGGSLAFAATQDARPARAPQPAQQPAPAAPATTSEHHCRVSAVMAL
jgi:hypothetical protein